MDSAFAWLGQIASWVGSLIPTWVIIPATHNGVRFRRGSKTFPLEAGVHWFWPASTLIQTYPTARQTVDLRTQALMTTDGKVVAVGGMVTYRVTDIEALLVRTFDADQTIKDICGGVISETVRSCAWADLQTPQFQRELTLVMRKRLEGFGVKVTKATLTDLAPCRVLKLVQSQSADVG